MVGIVSVVILVLIGYFVVNIIILYFGFGGVMLFNYFLLVIVEQFGILNIFYFGWIDFGFGCVLGSDQLIMCVLCCYMSGDVDNFLCDVVELVDWFDVCDLNLYVCLVFGYGECILVWLLGLSFYSV